MNEATPPSAPGAPQPSGGAALVRLVIEAGPLAVFFIANARAGIYWGTGLFMVAITLSLIVSLVRERRIPAMPMVTAVVVLVFGSLTLYLHDDTFIKLKPTIVNSLFAAFIFVGLAIGRNFVRVVLGPAFQLTDEGWRVLAIRWGAFFVVLAIVNEVVWRNFSTDVWVDFKVFGIMPLTFAFSLAQVPLLTRHGNPPPGAAPNEGA